MCFVVFIISHRSDTITSIKSFCLDQKDSTTKDYLQYFIGLHGL